MKTRVIALVLALVISALAVMGLGAYIKYELLRPYGLAQDNNIVELPFLVLTDAGLRYSIETALRGEPEDPATEPTTAPTTVPGTEPSTQPTIIPPTEPGVDSTTEPAVTDPSHTHRFEMSSVVEPTCTEEGYAWHYCVCGTGYADSFVTAKGHSYQTSVLAPTCSEDGYTWHECSGCDEDYADTWVEKLEHTYSSVVVEPTTEAEGYTEHTCSACGDSYRDNYTPVLPTEPKGPVPQESYTYPGYDFSPGAVPDSWYDNVLFIGDSRTVGLRDYARSGNAEYFCSVGMSVFSAQSTRCADINFSSQTLASLLSSRTYDKILISLGINECGYATSSLISAYQDLIDLIRQYQPDAKIVLQAIMTVSKSYSSASYFQPDHIFSINERIKGMADNSTIFYIDVNEYFTDPDGYLYKDISGDGCHLYAKYYGVWAQWISHAVGNLGI